MVRDVGCGERPLGIEEVVAVGVGWGEPQVGDSCGVEEVVGGGVEVLDRGQLVGGSLMAALAQGVDNLDGSVVVGEVCHDSHSAEGTGEE